MVMLRLYRAALMVLAVAFAGAVVGAAAIAHAQPQQVVSDHKSGAIVFLRPDLQP